MRGSHELFLVEQIVDGVRLTLLEPTEGEVRVHAQSLSDYYNEPTNRALLTNAQEFTAEAVVDQFAEMRADGGRPFLLMVDGALVGDSDLRRVEGRRAEYAVMVGPRASQAKGLGTRFSLMVLVLAFERLGLDEIYASVRPENAGSLRMLEKVGYVVDASPAARRYAEASDDLCLSITATTLGRMHREEIARIRIEPRDV